MKKTIGKIEKERKRSIYFNCVNQNFIFTLSYYFLSIKRRDSITFNNNDKNREKNSYKSSHFLSSSLLLSVLFSVSAFIKSFLNSLSVLTMSTMTDFNIFESLKMILASSSLR